MDSLLKVAQRWGLSSFQANWARGLLDSVGSFLQLIFTFILFALADHPQRERQWPPSCPPVIQLLLMKEAQLL